MDLDLLEVSMVDTQVFVLDSLIHLVLHVICCSCKELPIQIPSYVLVYESESYVAIVIL